MTKRKVVLAKGVYIACKPEPGIVALTIKIASKDELRLSAQQVLDAVADYLLLDPEELFRGGTDETSYN